MALTGEDESLCRSAPSENEGGGQDAQGRNRIDQEDEVPEEKENEGETRHDQQGNQTDEPLNAEKSQDDSVGGEKDAVVEHANEDPLEIKQEPVDPDDEDNDEDDLVMPIRPSILKTPAKKVKFEDMIKLKIECPKCEKSFTVLSRIIKHLRDAHEIGESSPVMEDVAREMGKVLCHICREEIVADYNQVWAHFRETHSITILQLKRDPGKYMRRISRAETVEEETFSDERNTKVVNRARLHTNDCSVIKRAICPGCSKSFTGMARLARHCRQDHDGEISSDKLAKVRQAIGFSRCLKCQAKINGDYDNIASHFKSVHKMSMSVVSSTPEDYLEHVGQTIDGQEDSAIESTPVVVAKRQLEKDPTDDATPMKTRKIESDDFTAICPWCKNVYYSFTKLFSHAVSIHGVEKPSENQQLAILVSQTACSICEHIMLRDFNSIDEHFRQEHDASALEVKKNIEKYLKAVPSGQELPIVVGPETSENSVELQLPRNTKPLLDELLNAAPSGHAKPDGEENDEIDEQQPPEDPEARVTWHELRCPWCPLSYATGPQFKRHVLARHNRPQSDPKVVQVLEGVGRVQCRICGAKTKTTYANCVDHFRSRHKDVEIDHIKENPNKLLMVTDDDPASARKEAKTMAVKKGFTKLQCPWCEFKSFYAPSMKQHFGTVHDKHEGEEEVKAFLRSIGKVECKLCKAKIRATYKDVAAHFSQRHKGQDMDSNFNTYQVRKDKSKLGYKFPRFHCPFCKDFSSVYIGSLQKHASCVHGKSRTDAAIKAVIAAAPQVHCDLCGAVVRGTYKEIKLHFGSAHQGEEPSQFTTLSEEDPGNHFHFFRCPWCPFKTVISHHLKCHLAKHHKDHANDKQLPRLLAAVRKVRCSLCKCILKGSYIILKKHFLEKHKKTTFLGLFNKISETANSSNGHESTNADESGGLFPSYQCPWCSYASTQLHKLNVHVKSSHKEEENSEKRINAVVKSLGHVQCKLCQKILRRDRHVVNLHFRRTHPSRDDWKEQFVKLTDEQVATLNQERMKNRSKNPEAAEQTENGNSIFHHYKCPWCSFKSLMLSKIKAHAAAQHGKEGDDDEIKKVQEDVPKNQCKVCNGVIKGDYNAAKCHFFQRHRGQKVDLREQFTRLCIVKQPSLSKPKNNSLANAFHRFKCPWCSCTSSKSFYIQTHAKTVHGKEADSVEIKAMLKGAPRNQCKLCGGVFRADYQGAKWHFRKKHNGQKVEILEQLTRLPNAAESAKTFAKLCQSPFGNIENLKLRCPLCRPRLQGRFSRMKDLMSHCQIRHPEHDQDFLANRCVEERGLIRCLLCGLLLERRYRAFDAHLRGVHKRPIQSFVKEYGREALRTTRLLRCATRLNIECPLCDQSFVGSRHLVQHMDEKHKLKYCISKVISIIAKKLNIAIQMRTEDMSPEELEREQSAVDTEKWDAQLDGAQREKDDDEENTQENEANGDEASREETNAQVDGEANNVDDRDDDVHEEVGISSEQSGTFQIKISQVMSKKKTGDKRNEDPLLDVDESELEETFVSVGIMGANVSTNVNGDPDSEANEDDTNASTEYQANEREMQKSSQDSEATSHGNKTHQNSAEIAELNNNDHDFVRSILAEEKALTFSDGCVYSCRKCDDQPKFANLSAMKRHVKQNHGGGPHSFLGLKSSRIQERLIKCRICGLDVVHDRIELGFHVWTLHGLDLETYAAI